MYTVLVPLDDTMGRARRQARYVTSLPCADEEVLAVLGHALTDEEKGVPEAMRRVSRVETVRRTIDILEEEGVSYETRELSSPPAEGIFEVAKDEEVDEIVMGGRKRSPAEKAILGSVTQNVVLNSDVPVVVTGSE